MSLREQALKMGGYGWSVFPVEDKMPLIMWKEGSSCDPGLIGDMPWGLATHVGINCGKSKIWVLDIDDPEMLEELAPPPTLVQTTQRSGGLHYIYQAGEFDQRNTAGAPLKGVDIRANGGYIVWYGNGKGTPAPWPYKTVIGNKKKEPLHSDGMGYDEGTRNDSLFRALCGKVDSMDDEELMMFAIGLNAVMCKPPLPRGEVVAVVTQAIHYRENPPEDAQDSPEPFYAFRGAFSEIPEMAIPESFCGEWLRQGTYTMVYARSGVGKTGVCADLVYSMKKGLRWMGQLTKDPGKVVWINGDMEVWQAKERLGSLAAFPDVEFVHVVDKNLMGYQDELVRVCEGAGVVVLDNFSAMFQLADINSAESWPPYNSLMRRIYSTGTAIVSQHQAGKGEGNSFLGSVAQEQTTVNVIRIGSRILKPKELEETNHQTSRVKSIMWTKHRMCVEPKPCVFDFKEEWGRLVCDIDPFEDLYP